MFITVDVFYGYLKKQTNAKFPGYQGDCREQAEDWGCLDTHSLHVCKQGMGKSHAMSTLEFIQHILLTPEQKKVSALLRILLEILHIAVKRTQSIGQYFS